MLEFGARVFGSTTQILSGSTSRDFTMACFALHNKRSSALPFAYFASNKGLKVFGSL
jgi:hypothetical protein